MSSTQPKTIICAKWGTKFPASDVNRLYRMVCKYLSPPRRFVCFTDDPTGFAEGVESRPLPTVPIVGHLDIRAWKRLGLFSNPLSDLKGTVLSLDLDVVMTESIDPFFEAPGTFVMPKDYRYIRFKRAYTGNGSVMRYEAGAHADILEHLIKLDVNISKHFRNDQELISYVKHEKGQLAYWPKPWCPSWRYDCVRQGPLGWFQDPILPPGSKILIFHGKPKPEDAVVGGVGSKWYRHVRAAPWLKEYLI